jgi:hypothetical protein
MFYSLRILLVDVAVDGDPAAPNHCDPQEDGEPHHHYYFSIPKWPTFDI